MEIRSDNQIQHLIDEPISLRCPHCGTSTALVPVSIPRFELILRFRLTEAGLVCRCSSCNAPVFLRYRVRTLSNPIVLDDDFVQVTTALEPFEMNYLAGAILDDFREALICYSASCWNAFAAMCRRCIQSISTTLGAEGTTKVQAQLQELKEMGVADPNTFDLLREIMLSGHDGAHPHLPALSPARAAVLLHLMNDVLYQLFVRPAKIREASELRKQAIAKG